MIDWNSVSHSVIKLINASHKKILIQLGHFPLICTNDEEIIPAIIEEINDNNIINFVKNNEYIGDFSSKTFISGVKIASMLRSYGFEIYFSFIVNDWQWIKKGPYIIENPKIDKFYIVNKLPLSFANTLRMYGFSFDNIMTSCNYIRHSLYFSEAMLRKEGKKFYSKYLESPCAIEYLSFLKCIRNDFDCIISFVPSTCEAPILLAANEYVNRIYRKMDMVHVFYGYKDNYCRIDCIN